jgi:hypothetical protein
MNLGGKALSIPPVAPLSEIITRLRGIIVRLRKIPAQAVDFTDTNQPAEDSAICQAVTSPHELQSLQTHALDAMYQAGEDASHAYREIDGLDFSGVFLSRPHLTVQRAEQEILPRVERFVELLELAAQKPQVTQRPKRSEPTTKRYRQRKKLGKSKEPIQQEAPKPAKARARTIARLIGELNVLKPQMNSEQDYGRLAKSYPEFLCFRIAEQQPKLRVKLENLQDHCQHVRLAQELAAAYHGVSVATAQTDWKKHKPRDFRKH